MYVNSAVELQLLWTNVLLWEQVGGVLSRIRRPLCASSPRSTSCQRPLPLSSRRSRRRRSLTLCTPRTLGIQETVESSKSLPRSLIPTATHTSTKTLHWETQTHMSRTLEQCGSYNSQLYHWGTYNVFFKLTSSLISDWNKISNKYSMVYTALCFTNLNLINYKIIILRLGI